MSELFPVTCESREDSSSDSQNISVDAVLASVESPLPALDCVLLPIRRCTVRVWWWAPGGRVSWSLSLVRASPMYMVTIANPWHYLPVGQGDSTRRATTVRLVPV